MHDLLQTCIFIKTMQPLSNEYTMQQTRPAKSQMMSSTPRLTPNNAMCNSKTPLCCNLPWQYQSRGVNLIGVAGVQLPGEPARIAMDCIKFQRNNT